jgi:hypothetical protein
MRYFNKFELGAGPLVVNRRVSMGFSPLGTHRLVRRSEGLGIQKRNTDTSSALFVTSTQKGERQAFEQD